MARRRLGTGTEPAVQTRMPRRFSFPYSHRRLPIVAFLCGGVLWLATLAVSAQQAPAAKPVTIQELTLLLHGGYTDSEVAHETIDRPLLTPLDEAGEKTLRAAGADQSLIDTLKARATLTSDQAAAARQLQAAIDARNTQGNAEYASRMRQVNQQIFTEHRAERKQEELGKLAASLRGKLVTLRDGSLQPPADTALDGKMLFALYFAADTPACRLFTSKLTAFYQDFEPKHTAFEIVFISEDRSADAMENLLRQVTMPWPALTYSVKAQVPDLVKLGSGTLPRLVLVDGEGRLVSDSYVEGKYVGPQHVLDDLTKLAVAGGNPPPVSNVSQRN